MNENMNPVIYAAICIMHLLFALNVLININRLLVALLLDFTSGSHCIEVPS